MWLNDGIPPIRWERHYDARLVRCYAERPANLYALFTEALQRNPEGEALVCGGLRLTYRDLDRTVGQAASGLQGKGLTRGDRLGLLLGNGPAFLVYLLAAAKLGAISVPINVREGTPGLAHMLNDSGCKLLAVERALAERLPPRADLPFLADCLFVEAPRKQPESDAAEPLQPSAAVEEEETAVILYTSGTTGRPKGAMLTGLGIVQAAMHFSLTMALTEKDRSLLLVPMSHVTGLVAQIATMLRAGGCLVVGDAFKAATALDLLAQEAVTHCVMVPAMYNLCLLDRDLPARDLSAWRVGAYGGAPMPEATIAGFAKALPGLNLMNVYGATETTSPVTVMPPQETARHSRSVGRPLPCVTLAVMDEAGKEVPPGETGELWLGGPGIVPGYWQNPEATAAEFVGGWWRSGDIGAVDADGFVYIFDRLKDVINRGGYKIYSIEVENVLLGHPDVLEAALIAEACPVLGERSRAVVVPKRKEDSLDQAALSAFCAARLSDYKIPDFWTLRREPLPRNANGKVLKRALRGG